MTVELPMEVRGIKWDLLEEAAGGQVLAEIPVEQPYASEYDRVFGKPRLEEGIAARTMFKAAADNRCMLVIDGNLLSLLSIE